MTDPIIVTTVSSGDGGHPLPAETMATTPDHLPDIIVKVVSPLVAILVRTARTYVNTIVGLIAVGVTGSAPQALPPSDFKVLLAHAAGLAIAPAVVSALTNFGILLAKLDQKFPTLQA